MTPNSDKAFADYWDGAENWITLASGEYYPDILEDACNLYSPVLAAFGQLLSTSYSLQLCSKELAITGTPGCACSFAGSFVDT